MTRFKSCIFLLGLLVTFIVGVSSATAIIALNVAPPNCRAVPFLDSNGKIIDPKPPMAVLMMPGESYCRQKSPDFWKADQIVYIAYPNKIVEDVDTDSFLQLWGGLARDKNHVYWDGAILPTANVDTAKYIGGAFWKDDKHVFFKGMILPDADPSSFKTVLENKPYPCIECYQGPRVSYSYGKDNTHVYWENKELPNADPVSFQARNADFATDKNNGFFHDQGAPLSACKDLGNVTIIGKTVYWGHFPVNGADAATWEQLPYGYARDKNAVYNGLDKLNGVDPASFQVINECFALDKSKYYRLNARRTRGVVPLDMLQGHEVRTLDRAKDSELFKVCTSGSYDKYGTSTYTPRGMPSDDGEYPGTCCVRDETNLYLFANDPMEDSIPAIGTLKALPIKDIQCTDQHRIKFNNTVYLGSDVFESVQNIIRENSGHTDPALESAAAWGKSCAASTQ